MAIFSREEGNALLLSFLAGLSTVLGAVLAVSLLCFGHAVELRRLKLGQPTSVFSLLQVIVRPGPALLGFLLGVAIGVMGLLSVVELWIKNAVDHGVLVVTVALAVGAALYYFAHPFFPDFQQHPHSNEDSQVLTACSSSCAGV